MLKSDKSEVIMDSQANSIEESVVSGGAVIKPSLEGAGAGDVIVSVTSNSVEVEDPEKVVCLGMEELSLEDTDDERSVYRACSVDTFSRGLPPVTNGHERRIEGIQELTKDSRDTVSSSWSITKLFRSSFFGFKCCNKVDDDENPEEGIELENLCETEKGGRDTVDEVDVPDPAAGVAIDADASENAIVNEARSNRVTCFMGPILTVDCSNLSVDVELQRIRASLGDVIRKLIIRNSPMDSATRMLSEPLVNENVTSIFIDNCDVTIKSLCLILGSFKLLEQLHIEVKGVGPEKSSLLYEDFQNYCNSGDNLVKQLNEDIPCMESRPRRLKTLSVSLPLIWQCGLICRVVGAYLQDCRLEEINIKSSLKAMIVHLATTNGVEFGDESTWQSLLTLEARDLIEKNKSSLKHLTLACADTFPLEYLKTSKTHGIPIEDVFKWCFLCTCGILNSIANFDGDKEGNENAYLLLPELKNLSFNLPLVPIPMTQDDDFRKPLNAVAEFLARNSSTHVVTLQGLRPVKGMENWIRNSLVTIPKYRMSIGCTYTSTTLAANLPTYDDELGSLGLEIVPDESRQRVTDIIDPLGKEVIPHTWRYTGMRCFHLINQLPTLISYDMDRIASKFSKLSKLVIEDYAAACETSVGENSQGARSLTDNDMQTIFQNLVCLEYLHLDCRMKDLTDRGLTGTKDSMWVRLSQRNKMFSFWYLYNLKYVFLRGFGEHVTDKSAVHAFSEEYSLKNLRELHVFAPGFTNYGREKIRRAYEHRQGFILQL